MALIFSDLFFGLVSLFLAHQCYKMLNCREEFKRGRTEKILIITLGLGGLFFVSYPLMQKVEVISNLVQFLHAYCIQLIWLSLALWLYFIIPKVRILPKESDLKEINNALACEAKANQSKSDFLARISHEIRTPLNAISGFSEILSSEYVTEQDKKNYLKTIQKNSQFLNRLINDILDFSKIEAGKIKFESKEINLFETLLEGIHTAEISIQNKPVKIILEPLAHDIPQFIKIDPLRFRQIFLNMLSNSVKFTD